MIEFKTVSASCKDLIRCMICKYETRITSANILKHEWVRENLNKSKLINIEYIKKFQCKKIILGSSNFKKMILTLIASKLSENEVMQIGSIFSNVDSNKDGKLSLGEIMHGL